MGMLSRSISILSIRENEPEKLVRLLPLGDSTNCKTLIDTVTLATDHNPMKDLDALLVPFDHSHVHGHTVADLEIVSVILEFARQSRPLILVFIVLYGLKYFS